jgi:hypothetical protein
MQMLYAEEFRRQAETLSALARLTEPHANTDNERCLVAVTQGLADVCRMLAEACETESEEVKAVE